mgnify:CR=1 FL=1
MIIREEVAKNLHGMKLMIVTPPYAIYLQNQVMKYNASAQDFPDKKCCAVKPNKVSAIVVNKEYVSFIEVPKRNQTEPSISDMGSKVDI